MSERKEKTPETVEDRAQFKHAITAAIEHVSAKVTRKEEGEIIVLAVGNTLFPQSILAVGKHLGKDEGQTRECSILVEQHPRLKRIYAETIEHLRQSKLLDPTNTPNEEPATPIQHEQSPEEGLADIPPDNIVYEHRWEGKTARNPGLSTERFKIIIAEHTTRYPDIPLNLTKVGEAMGQYSRQRAWQILTDLKERGELPEGLLLQKTKTKKPKKG